jgi:hypothetical protein
VLQRGRGVYTWCARGPARVNTTVMGFRVTSYAVLIFEASFEDLPVQLVFLAFSGFFSHLLHMFLVTPCFSLVYIGFHADFRKIRQQNTRGLKGMVHLTKFDVSSALK